MKRYVLKCVADPTVFYKSGKQISTLKIVFTGEINMKKTLLFICAFAMTSALASCGNASGPSAGANTSFPKPPASETTAVETAAEEAVTETTSVSAENTEVTTAAENAVAADTVSETGSWFGEGVYELLNNGTTDVYYVFNGDNSGRTCDPERKIGIGFNFEQYKDKVVFHMGSVDDNTEMAMSYDVNGNMTGVINGTTYTIRKVEGAEPSAFEPTLSDDSQSKPMIEDAYEGTYSESHAHRGVITVTSAGGSTYNVHIHWAGSAAEEAVWDFSGEFNGRQVLNYSNCTKTHNIYDENGLVSSEVEYTDGTGYLQIAEDGENVGFTWHDNVEDAGADSYFIKD